jgi:hypothetical protein
MIASGRKPNLSAPARLTYYHPSLPIRGMQQLSV